MRLWLASALLLCGASIGIPTAAEPTSTPTHAKAPALHGFPETAIEYAKMVEGQLGVPPRVNLDEAVEIPIYVDGVQKYGNFGTDCDNPTRLGKDTISGSVIQRYVGRTAEGEPLPNVVWVAFGRNASDNPRRIVGSVQMIGYDTNTGATAFFESSDRLEPWVSLDPKTLRMRGELPWIDDPQDFNRAFVPPGDVQCVECHQADPFITNTFINAAKIPGTDEPVIPILDSDAPYFVIGGEKWDMRTIHIEDNACFNCHRVGQGTLKLFMNAGWDPNEHMPPHQPGSLKDDLRQVLEAVRKGPDKVEGAEWIVPPQGDKSSRVVSHDYPYKAAFNEPASGKGKFAKPSNKKSPALTVEQAAEIEALLKQLEDDSTRDAFEAWFKEHGADPEALEKLRQMTVGKGKGIKE